MATIPSRNGQALDVSNDQMREDPVWQAEIQRMGFRLDGSPITLSDQQRRSLKAALERAGYEFPKGMEIDPAGNANQNQGFGVQLKKWGPIAGQVGLGIATGGMSLPASLALNAGVGAGLGAATGGGVRGALTGAATGAASAAGGQLLRGLGSGGAGGVLPSGRAIGTDIAMRGVPGAIGSQGVSASVGPLAGLMNLGAPSLETALGPAPFAAGGPPLTRAIPGLAGAVPGAVTGSQGVSAALGGGSAMGSVLRNLSRGGGDAADEGGQSLLDRILGGVSRYGPLAAGAGSLIAGLTQGRPPAEDRLNGILQMAEDRARQQEPLFKAITNMAQRQLPTFARER